MELTFRDMHKSPAVEAMIHRQVEKLDRQCDHLDSCRIAVERPHRRHRRSPEYRVRIDLTVPPKHELVVTKESLPGGPRDDLYRVVNEAFDAARRQLAKLTSIQDRRVKSHPEQDVQATVVRILDGYGFLLTPDGRELYFHEHSVLSPGFEALRVGTGVAFSEEMGRKGPQASSVRIVENRPKD